jgi:2-polyprenyl-3-methyl-5-hydroxy-6-metoxy-1,4-benzoquinol methylase
MNPEVSSETQAELPALIQVPQDLPRLNKWLFETAHPYINGKVLEVNSGVGEISSHFVLNGIQIHLSDAEKTNRDILRKRFEGTATVRGVHHIDFLRPDFTRRYSSRMEIFDTLIALNVAEHGYLAKTVLDNAKLLLHKGGFLMLIAPAITAPYYGLEENMEDWQKYNRSPLKRFLGTDFKVILTRCFNLRDTITDPSCNKFGVSILVIARKGK